MLNLSRMHQLSLIYTVYYKIYKWFKVQMLFIFQTGIWYENVTWHEGNIFARMLSKRKKATFQAVFTSRHAELRNLLSEEKWWITNVSASRVRHTAKTPVVWLIVGKTLGKRAKHRKRLRFLDLSHKSIVCLLVVFYRSFNL